MQIGRPICTVHQVELVPQSLAREMGLTTDQPSLDAWVCPESGILLSSFEAAERELDDLNEE
jgi:hypothetical protein